jgi:hypothetical protein
MGDNFIILTYTVNRSVNEEKRVLQRLGNVDFPLSSASVMSRKFMKVNQLKKAIVAVMLLLMFTIGGFALSQAHDNVPCFAFSLELGFGLSHGAWERDSYPLQFGLASEIGRFSSHIQTLAEGTRLFGMVPPVRAHSLVYLRVHAPKISLHLLDSILLI